MTDQTTHETVSAAYDQGVEDGIRQERERVRAVLLRSDVVDHAAAARDWAGCDFPGPIDTSRWLHLAESIKDWERAQVIATIETALQHIGLRAVEEESEHGQ